MIVKWNNGIKGLLLSHKKYVAKLQAMKFTNERNILDDTLPEIRPLDVTLAQLMVKYSGNINGAMNTWEARNAQLRFIPDSMISRPNGIMAMITHIIHQDLYCINWSS